MTTSDTPETDAEAITPSGFEADEVSAEFARKLERERDEARNKMADALQEVDLRTLDYERMRQERDEAREAFVIATDQMVQAQCKLRKSNTERDEARERMADALQEVDLRMLDFERMKQERDKAMEALMKIEDLFIDGTDIYADRENMGLIAREALEGTK